MLKNFVVICVLVSFYGVKCIASQYHKFSESRDYENLPQKVSKRDTQPIYDEIGEEKNVFYSTGDINQIIQVDNESTTGSTMLCPSTETCRDEWKTPGEWSACVVSIPPSTLPQCYRSIHWRLVQCRNDSQCVMFEWELCLNNATCLGQWAGWTEFENTCDSSCRGNITRKRFCYKDGGKVEDLCLGSPGNNQTQYKKCGLQDCVDGRTIVTTTTTTTSNNSIWPYTFYGTIALCIVLLFVFSGFAIYKIRSRKPDRNNNESHAPSESFSVAGATPTFPLDFPGLNGIAEHPAFPPTRFNQYQTINLERNTINQPPLITSPTRKRSKNSLFFRKLPSLPRPNRQSTPTANQSNQQPVMVGTNTTMSKFGQQNPDFFPQHSGTMDSVSGSMDSHETYTRMESFSSNYSASSGYSRSKSVVGISAQKYRRSNKRNREPHKLRGVSEGVLLSTHRSSPISGTQARVTKRKVSLKQQGSSRTTYGKMYYNEVYIPTEINPIRNIKTHVNADYMKPIVSVKPTRIPPYEEISHEQGSSKAEEKKGNEDEYVTITKISN